MVKRLAEINLVKGDYAATRKYLRILQKTFVWSRWANRAFSSLGTKATTDEKALLQQYIESVRSSTGRIRYDRTRIATPSCANWQKVIRATKSPSTTCSAAISS